jgi:hypothetical protein
VKRDFFLLNAAFAIVILDLICSQYLNKDKDHGKDMLVRAIVKLNFKDILFQPIINIFFVFFTFSITNNNLGLNIVPY